MAKLLETLPLLLEVLLEARLVLPLDLGGAGPRIVSAPPASATSEADGLHPHAAAHAQRRRRWAPVARSPTAARAREVRSAECTDLRGLLCVLLVCHGGVVRVRGAVERLGGLVLLLHGLVDGVLRLVRGLPGGADR